MVLAANGNCLTHNEIYGNTGDGVKFYDLGIAIAYAADNATILCHNDINLNGGDGLNVSHFSTAGDHFMQIIAFLNRLDTNTGYGVNTNGFGFSSQCWHYFDHNNVYGNVAGATDITSGLPGTNNVTTDPGITRTDGSEDFTASEAHASRGVNFPGFKGTGVTNYIDIGSVQRQDPAGGGGTDSILGAGGLRGGLS